MLHNKSLNKNTLMALLRTILYFSSALISMFLIVFILSAVIEGNFKSAFLATIALPYFVANTISNLIEK